jgi:hypothetical protein
MNINGFYKAESSNFLILVRSGLYLAFESIMLTLIKVRSYYEVTYNYTL